MRTEFFKAWHRSGLSNLEARPLSDYSARLKRVERVLKTNLDDVPLDKINRIIKKIEKENFKKVSEAGLNSLRSAVKKYWEFRTFMRKTFS